MSSRVIIPEIVGETGGRGARSGAAGGFPRGGHRRAPATGLGPLLRSFAAALVLLGGLAAALLVGGMFLIVLGGIFLVAWVGSWISGRGRRGGARVVVRSSRTEGPGGSTIFIERHIEAGDRGPGRGA